MIIKFFHAEWCGPCNQFHPIIENVAKELQLTFEDHDIEVSTEVDLYGIRSVPTTIITTDSGEVLSKFSGLKSRMQIIELINSIK